MGRIRVALGPDLLVALCRCFVHENRLLTMAHYRALIRQHTMDRTASVERSKVAMLWLEVGTIRELGRSLFDLRKVLAQRGWLDATGFDTLDAIGVRWRKHFTGHRNSAAFHVDEDVVALGLSRIPDGPLPLMAGDSARHDESWIALGDVALMQGMHGSQAEADSLVRTVRSDREAVVVALLKVFTHCARRAGLSYGEQGA